MYITIRHRNSDGSVANGFEARQSNETASFEVVLPSSGQITFDISHLSQAEKENGAAVEFIAQGNLEVVSQGPNRLVLGPKEKSLTGTVEIKTVECHLIGTIKAGERVKFSFPYLNQQPNKPK